MGLAAAGAASLPGKLAAEGRTRQSDWDAPSPDSRRQRARPRLNPVSFWNEASLALVALDHSIDAKDARAPGPCAAARALGLVHIVMADAAAAVYPVDFEGFYVRGVRFPDMRHPEVFVGGAAAWILEHIYSTPAHTQFIGAQRLRFLQQFDQHAFAAWNAGLTFARHKAFAARWNWNAIKVAALRSTSRYAAAPGEHEADPFNPDQKYYGVQWGRMEPLVPQLRIGALGPGDPPGPGDREYWRDADEVREVGAWRAEGPTTEQLRTGMFWAYDGARLIGPPPRLYNQIVRQIAEADAMPVPDMARLLALCNVAMADAGIVAWEAKYRYRIWRPVIAIPELYNLRRGWKPFGSPRTNPTQFALGIDTQFRLMAQSMLGGGHRNTLRAPAKDLLAYHRACFTPNFPAYPSGHSTFGSACFNMLKLVRAEHAETRRDPGRLDGYDEFVSDELNGISIDNFQNEPRPYVPIRYRHIDHMIEDNNRSRIYLGVHWNFDCERGAESGAGIADAIYRHAYIRADDPRGGASRPRPGDRRR